MNIGKLGLTLHRTVRVKDGRQPANLPPSLGVIDTYQVAKYKDKCPATWEEGGIFAALHDVEALWMSFHPQMSQGLALLIGAGGVNALTGEKLGTKLEEGNYIVAPPQPWLDGWKSKGDGCVYQFIATPHQKGEGKSVAEQLIGAESVTGGIGIAVFESKKPLKPTSRPQEVYGGTPYMEVSDMMSTKTLGVKLLKSTGARAASSPTASSKALRHVSETFSEMGLGKGGQIIQKIYPDPHGLDVWNESPSATSAIYIVDAITFEEITGIKVPPPVSQESYGGSWFGLQDQTLGDVPGTEKFTGLESVFPGNNVEKEKPEEVKEEVKAAGE